jgi:hypothetical protein
VLGHNDGLKVDPVTHLVWALQNEDGNPNLAVIDPTAGTTTSYTFEPVANGGGFDDITFLGGRVYLTESNPQSNPNTAPAVVQVTLSGTKALVTTVLLGNATATNAVTNMTVTLNLQDPDSMTADPAGDLVLTSQADDELVIIHNPGLANQSVTLLPLTDTTNTPVSVDDTLFPPNSTGQILMTDLNAGVVYSITGPAIVPGLVLSAGVDIGQLGSLSTSTGVFTPVVTGLGSPRGLAFQQGLGFSGNTVSPVATPAVIYSPHPNLDEATAFVRGLYQSVLGRSADAGGLGGWLDLMNAGLSRLAVATDIWNSAEHRSEQVDGYYRSFLHRAAAATERSFWVNQFLTGANEAAVVLGIVTSSEYVGAHGGSAYVPALFMDIFGRAPDQAGLTFWQNQLTAGATMAQVAAGIINSSESDLRAIDDYYAAFLQRVADTAGANSWVQGVQAGALNFGSVAISLLASGEYSSNAAANVP